MASASPPPIPALLLLLSPLLCTALVVPDTTPGPSPPPTPTPWPPQFHSLQYVNTSGVLTVMDLWYDWPKGRNLNTIQRQLGELVYDLEWTNGTSFYYTLDSSRKCKTVHFGYGILRPNWLEGAEYLGRASVDGFLCDVWTKVDFIWYYEDVVTRRPVHWLFFTGMSIHVMTFEVGATLEDEKWQAPAYCFDKKKRGEEVEGIGGEGFGDHMKFLKRLDLEGRSDQ